MPDNGFGWDTAHSPPTSDEFIAVQKRYYDHAIECFGPKRCMFESNFPVDRWSISYPVLWNAFKKMNFDFFCRKNRNRFVTMDLSHQGECTLRRCVWCVRARAHSLLAVVSLTGLAQTLSAQLNHALLKGARERHVA